jgi:polyhydroxyalkanoate synthase subunit PhaC
MPPAAGELWGDGREPGLLERLALDATATPRVAPEVLDELAEPQGRVASALSTAAAFATLPLRTDARRAAGMAARAPRGALRILAGRSAVSPHRGDRRFEAPGYRENPALARVAQAYLGIAQAVDELLDGADLDWKTERRLRLAADNALQALAPTNFVATNPEALKRIVDTGGLSLLAGLRHFIGDMASAPRIPTSVDPSKFEIGGNLATTPGSVVLRTDMLELIQYAPATESVHAVPMLLVSSMVNKFYVLDLSPGRSLVEHLRANGHTVFAISWRNPGPEQADWDLDRYARALLAALDAVAAITGADRANVMALCAGGTVSAATACALAAAGHGDRINTLTLSVCAIDSAFPSGAGVMVTRRTAPWLNIEAARRGYVEGHQVAGAFAWLRPNEGVWSYWVNNYLMGKSPPAVDILYWAADSTNLPAALNRDMSRLSLENAFVTASDLRCLGAPLDLSAVTSDAYVIAAKSDHLTAWQSTYSTPHLLGGRSRFVLSSGGHISATVNPPAKARGGFWTGPTEGRAHDEWLQTARFVEGSWWPDWAVWLKRRSGRRVAAPAAPGGPEHPAGDPSPGRYVHVRSGAR